MAKVTRSISLVHDPHDMIAELTVFISALFKPVAPSQV